MGQEERTLLAKMGFQDADRRDPRHDLACAYLAEEAQARKLAEIVEPPRAPHEKGAQAWVIQLSPAQTEYVVRTKSGFAVGFVDVLLYGEWMIGDEESTRRGRKVLIEVKISPVSSGELLRQLKLYQATVAGEAWPAPAMVAAVAYGMTAAETRTLKREGVTVVRLAAGFETWCAANADRQGEPDVRF